MSSSEEDAAIQIEQSIIKSTKVKKLLEIHTDCKLKFDTHVDTICKKAHRKLTPLSRITNYMELPKRRILMNPVFKAQFNYFPIIWMFHSCSLNNKINSLHEQCLRIIYNNKHSNFEELLNKDNCFSIHYSNVDEFATELYKVARDMSPKIMSEVFKLRETASYNLRHTSQFSTDPIHSIYNRTELALYLGPKIWEQIPAEIKNKESYDEFKRKIKKWKPVECLFRICPTFVPNLAFF